MYFCNCLKMFRTIHKLTEHLKAQPLYCEGYHYKITRTQWEERKDSGNKGPSSLIWG